MQAISSFLARVITFITEITRTLWQNLTVSDYSLFQAVLDIFLVAILFYWLIMLIRGSRAVNIVFGLFVLALVFLISRWFKLIALEWILDRLLTVVLVAIPIIFQQELRRGLEKLGRTKFFLAQEAKEIDLLRSEIVESLFEMARQKMGALLVFRGEVSLKEYIDTGVSLNARISKSLLLSIFHPGTPLHDGAVIIDQNRAIAGGCVLPHSFKEYEHTFGTRHKAALGLSEVTDAKIFVVSEQRGSVSYVNDGEMEKDISPERAAEILTAILAPKKLLKSRKLPHYAEKSSH